MLLPGSKTNRTQRTRLLRVADEFKTGFGEGSHKVSTKSLKRTYRNGEKEGGGFRHEWTVQSSRRVANLRARGSAPLANGRAAQLVLGASSSSERAESS